MLSGCFPTTQWTQVIAAIQQGDEATAGNALAEFCERYRSAILHFFQRRGYPPDKAEDYTQAFFTQRILVPLPERKGFIFAAEQKNGRKFRSFLCWVLWNFLNDQRRVEFCEKNGGKTPHIPLDELLPPGDGTEGKVFEKFGQEFDRVFALEIIQKAAARSRHSKWLVLHLRGEISQQDAAKEMGIRENSFKQAYHRFRVRLAQDLWTEVAKLVGPDEDEIRGEIKHLMSLFAETAP